MVRLAKRLTPQQAREEVFRVPDGIKAAPNTREVTDTELDGLLRGIAPKALRDNSAKGSRREKAIRDEYRQGPQYEQASVINRAAHRSLLFARRRLAPRMEKLDGIGAGIEQLRSMDPDGTARIKGRVQAYLRELGMNPGAPLPGLYQGDRSIREVPDEVWVDHDNYMTFNQSVKHLTDIILLGNIERGKQKTGILNTATLADRAMGETSWERTVKKQLKAAVQKEK